MKLYSLKTSFDSAEFSHTETHNAMTEDMAINHINNECSGPLTADQELNLCAGLEVESEGWYYELTEESAQPMPMRSADAIRKMSEGERRIMQSLWLIEDLQIKAVLKGERTLTVRGIPERDADAIQRAALHAGYNIEGTVRADAENGHGVFMTLVIEW